MEVINFSQFFEAKYKARKEDLIPLLKTETGEWYMDDDYEPSYSLKATIFSLKATILSLLFNLLFWTILIWLLFWLLISIHFLNLDEVKRSNCFLLSPKLLFLTFTLNYLKLKNFEPKSNLWYLASIWNITFVVISNRFNAKKQSGMSFRACPGKREPLKK